MIIKSEEDLSKYREEIETLRMGTYNNELKEVGLFGR
jgi:hypothetical protein